MFKKNLFFKRSLALRTTTLVSLIVLTLAVVFLFDIGLVLAQELGAGIEVVNKTIGLGADDPRVIAAKVINIALGFLGVIAVGLIIYAGFLWMTSAGDEEKIRKAKKILINAVIGLAIILSAWGITLFILNKLMGATGLGGPGGPGGGGGAGGGALGNGIIESHYPARNATEVPRNTNITVTFKEAMDATTITLDNFKIYPSDCDTKNNDCYLKKVDIVTNDDKTFKFDPADLLGSDKNPIWYTVYLGGGIKKANGDLAFGGLDKSYDWQFEVSTKLDLEPPQVISVFPYHCSDSQGQNCKRWVRNTVVQINFSEPIDPLTAAGKTSEFDNLGIYSFEIKNNQVTAGSKVNGTFVLAGDYKTVEFVSDDKCGVNSCGDDIYCLPANANLIGLVRAATLQSCASDADCQEAGTDFRCAPTPAGLMACQYKDGKTFYPKTDLLDGLADMAGNSLDGNVPTVPALTPDPGIANKLGGDKIAQGASNENNYYGVDDFYWLFYTSDKIDTTPPWIKEVAPKADETGIVLDKIIDITFDKLMMKSTFKPGCSDAYSEDDGYKEGLCLSAENKDGEPAGYWINAYDEGLDSNNNGKIDNEEYTNTHAQINHVAFGQNKTCNMSVYSNVKDMNQNCYQPCVGPLCPCQGSECDKKKTDSWGGNYPTCP